MLIRESFNLPNVVTKMLRSKAGIWFPEYDHFINPKNNVLAILGRPNGRRIIPGSNIVTNDGDLFYAEMSVGDSPTDAFDYWCMATAGTPGKTANLGDFTHIVASKKVQTAPTYPCVNDQDGDNTGAGTDVRTTSVSYTAADFNNGAITHGVITNTAFGAAEHLLSGWEWAASINKTAADTLKCFLNHTFTGV